MLDCSQASSYCAGLLASNMRLCCTSARHRWHTCQLADVRLCNHVATASCRQCTQELEVAAAYIQAVPGSSQSTIRHTGDVVSSCCDARSQLCNTAVHARTTKNLAKALQSQCHQMPPSQTEVLAVCLHCACWSQERFFPRQKHGGAAVAVLRACWTGGQHVMNAAHLRLGKVLECMATVCATESARSLVMGWAVATRTASLAVTCTYATLH